MNEGKNKMKEITNEMRNKLREALPKEACKPHPTKTFLTTINPIFVIERLNNVFGVGSWQVKNDVVISDIEKGAIVVKVALSIPEYGVYLEQFGGNDNGGRYTNDGNPKKGFDLGDCFKGACTDGLTKLASYLEIGISIYKNEGNVSNPIVKELSDEERAEKKKNIWIEFFIKMEQNLKNNPYDSLREYHDFIYSEYTQKTPKLADNQDFITLVDKYSPKTEIIVNKAIQKMSLPNLCKSCNKDISNCKCPIDAPVLAKIEG